MLIASKEGFKMLIESSLVTSMKAEIDSMKAEKIKAELADLKAAIQAEINNIQLGKSKVFKLFPIRSLNWLKDMEASLDAALFNYNKVGNVQILRDSIDNCIGSLRVARIGFIGKTLFGWIGPSMSSFSHGDWDCHDTI